MLENFLSREILEKIFLGSSIEQYIMAMVYFIVAVIILGILQKVILTKLEKLSKKTKNDIDDIVIEVVKSIKPRFYIILSIYIALQILSLNDILNKIIVAVFMLVITFQVATSLQTIIKYITKKFDGSEDSDSTQNATNFLESIVTIFVWVIGVLMILANIGVNVGSLLAGVGIGGIAIAFALKEILADLFASFSIYFDKPFKAGDSITIGDDSGTNWN